MTEPTQTANSMYSYDMILNGKKLSSLVQEIHKFNCTENGWFFNPLRPGGFGFDNLAICLGYVIPQITKETPIDVVADLIHQAWAINYIYWRDNKPWLRKGEGDTKANKPLNDERRNMCAVSKYEELPEDEKEKDLIIARWIQKQV